MVFLVTIKVIKKKLRAVILVVAALCFVAMVNSLACWTGATPDPDNTANNLVWTDCSKNFTSPTGATADKCVAVTANCPAFGSGDIRSFGCVAQSDYDASKELGEGFGCTYKNELTCTSDLCNSGAQLAFGAALVAAVVAMAL